MSSESLNGCMARQQKNLEMAMVRSNKRMNLYLAVLEEETTHKRPLVLWWLNFRIWLLK